MVATVKWVWQNYKVIVPGTNLVLETVGTYLFGKRFAIDENWRWIRIGAMGTLLSGVTVARSFARARIRVARRARSVGVPPTESRRPKRRSETRRRRPRARARDAPHGE